MRYANDMPRAVTATHRATKPAPAATADAASPTGRMTPSEPASRKPSLAAELRLAVMHTSRRLRLERSSKDITPGQFTVLAVLDRHGPLTPRELANHEKVRPPSMTRTLAALQHLGLVSRTGHPTDGRQVLMALTRQGKAEILETRRRRDAWLAKRLAQLDPAERDVLAQAATILAKVAE